ncbi:MAG: hypothetical protein ACXAC7_10865 [Candidatus Hodarchaeales archaeon]|jgi:hypothetical protein
MKYLFSPIEKNRTLIVALFGISAITLGVFLYLVIILDILTFNVHSYQLAYPDIHETQNIDFHESSFFHQYQDDCGAWFVIKDLGIQIWFYGALLIGLGGGLMVKAKIYHVSTGKQSNEIKKNEHLHKELSYLTYGLTCVVFIFLLIFMLIIKIRVPNEAMGLIINLQRNPIGLLIYYGIPVLMIYLILKIFKGGNIIIKLIYLSIIGIFLLKYQFLWVLFEPICG